MKALAALLALALLAAGCTGSDASDTADEVAENPEVTTTTTATSTTTTTTAPTTTTTTTTTPADPNSFTFTSECGERIADRPGTPAFADEGPEVEFRYCETIETADPRWDGTMAISYQSAPTGIVEITNDGGSWVGTWEFTGVAKFSVVGTGDYEGLRAEYTGPGGCEVCDLTGTIQAVPGESAAQDLVGTWVTSDGSTWEIADDSISITGGFIDGQTYTATGTTLELTDDPGARACPPTQLGTYDWKIEEDVLTLTVVSDSCSGRNGVLDGITLDRVE